MSKLRNPVARGLCLGLDIRPRYHTAPFVAVRTRYSMHMSLHGSCSLRTHLLGDYERVYSCWTLLRPSLPLGGCP